MEKVHIPDWDDPWSVFGYAVYHMQMVEQMVRLVSRLVLHDGEMSMETYRRMEKLEAKKTLGHFVGKLREAADLSPDFEELLKSVLQDRNDLVHNASAIPGWDMQTAAGQEVARSFCASLVTRGGRLSDILMALTQAWLEQNGINPVMDPESAKLAAELHREYGPQLDGIFGLKEAGVTRASARPAPPSSKPHRLK